MAHTDARTDQASTAELVSRLSEQVTTLVRDELAVARLELVAASKKAGQGAGLLGGAAIVALYGTGALVLTGGAALALVVPAWVAVLVTATVLLIGAAVAAVIGKGTIGRSMPPTPEAAIASGRRDVDAVMSAARSGTTS